MRAVLSRLDMRIEAVVSSSGALYGFAAYSLNEVETDGNGEPTDYLYELHVDEKVRDKGLGSAVLAVLGLSDSYNAERVGAAPPSAMRSRGALSPRADSGASTVLR